MKDIRKNEWKQALQHKSLQAVYWTVKKNKNKQWKKIGSSRKAGGLGDGNRRRASSLWAVATDVALGAVVALETVVAVKTLVDG